MLLSMACHTTYFHMDHIRITRYDTTLLVGSYLGTSVPRTTASAFSRRNEMPVCVSQVFLEWISRNQFGD